MLHGQAFLITPAEDSPFTRAQHRAYLHGVILARGNKRWGSVIETGVLLACKLTPYGCTSCKGVRFRHHVIEEYNSPDQEAIN